ncbi:MAG: RCC1 domain-containing protein [Bacteroidia bacterium]
MKSILVMFLLLLTFTFSTGQHVDAGNGHSLILDSNGVLWTVGRNNFGQLGNGNNLNSATPIKVEGLPKVWKMARGYDHSLALDYTGTIWAWGRNNYGQISTGEKYDYNIPQKLEFGIEFTEIEGGHWHTVAIANDSTVYTWGHNYWGELGNGTTEHSMYPVQVISINEIGDTTLLKEIVEIKCVGYHTLARNAKGEVFSWGSNEFGELGNSKRKHENVAHKLDLPKAKEVATGWHHSVVLDVDGNVWFWGEQHSKKNFKKENRTIKKPTLLKELSGIEKIACGSWHSLALDNKGQVWGWGKNNFAMLGTGDSTAVRSPIKLKGFTDVVEIGGGCFQTMAVTQNGNILTCGDNPSGQQGIGNYKRTYNAEKMMVNMAGVLSFDPKENPEENMTSDTQESFLGIDWTWKKVIISLLLLLSLSLNFVLLKRR